jgi:predicted Zn-dependent protease
MAAHIVHNRKVYMFAGIAPPNQFQAAQQPFVASIRSFRELSQSEASRIRPNRIDIYTVRNGDTWQALAARSGDLVKRSSSRTVTRLRRPCACAIRACNCSGRDSSK